MKKLISALVAAVVSAISAPTFGADWLYQLEQTAIRDSAGASWQSTSPAPSQK